MPLYNYRCRECDTEFDKRQSFSEDPITDCPTCETETEGSVYRVIQPAGVVFKGSGFYVTDTKSARDSLMGNGKKDSDSSADSNGNSNGTDKKSTEGTKSDKKDSATSSSTTSEAKSKKSSDKPSPSASPTK